MGGEADVSSLRFTGYRQALRGVGLPVTPALVQSMEALTLHAGARRTRETVASGVDFDGVFCVTDAEAMGVLRGLADVGVRVPEQVEVIGFDNVEPGADHEEFISHCSVVIRESTGG